MFGQELVDCAYRIVPGPFRLRPRSASYLLHDAVRRDDVGTYAHQLRIGFKFAQYMILAVVCIEKYEYLFSVADFRLY